MAGFNRGQGGPYTGASTVHQLGSSTNSNKCFMAWTNL